MARLHEEVVNAPEEQEPGHTECDDVEGVEAGLAVVGLVDGGHDDDDADEHRQHSRPHEHQSASPAEFGTD